MNVNFILLALIVRILVAFNGENESQKLNVLKKYRTINA